MAPDSSILTSPNFDFNSGSQFAPPMDQPFEDPWSYPRAVEFNPDFAPILPEGQLSRAKELAYTEEPWQGIGNWNHS